MSSRSLLARLLGWQAVVTGTACVLLVAGTMAASAVILRGRQDSELAELARAMCSGIAHEAAEPYLGLDIEGAAEHFFAESAMRGRELQLWHRDGRLLARTGAYPGLTHDLLHTRLPSSCVSLDAGDALGGTSRACVQLCDDEHFVRVAAQDALLDPEIRRSAMILLAMLPVAVLLGVVIGRVVIKKLLRPLEQLTLSTRHIVPGAKMSLGVGARSLELAELERAIDALLERLGETLEREKRFAQEAAHELRTPLTNLRLRLEKLRRQAGADSDFAEQTGAALSNLDALDRLMESLLILTRAEEGDLPVGPVNLCDLVRERTAGAERVWDTRSPGVELDVPDEVLVRGNEELLGLAVTNLLENAHKYAGAEARIRVRAFESGEFGAVSVEDNGPGIPAELRPFVFERFFRAPSHRHRVPGVGLGLAVVDAIVRRHGGRVDAGSSELGGEQLRIEIPLVSRRSGPVQTRGVE